MENFKSLVEYIINRFQQDKGWGTWTDVAEMLHCQVAAAYMEKKITVEEESTLHELITQIHLGLPE